MDVSGAPLFSFSHHATEAKIIFTISIYGLQMKPALFSSDNFGLEFIGSRCGQVTTI